MLGDIKSTLADTTLVMEPADINIVAKSIEDKYFKVLFPRSDDVEQLLEEILPTDEVPRAPGIIQSV